MFVTFEMDEEVNGYKIIDKNGLTRFVAEKDNIRIIFDTDAGSGRNYSKVISFYNSETDRRYKAQKYLLKYVSTVQGFSNYLFQKYLDRNEKNFSVYHKGNFDHMTREEVISLYEKEMDCEFTKKDEYSDYNLMEIMSGLGIKIELRKNNYKSV